MVVSFPGSRGWNLPTHKKTLNSTYALVCRKIPKTTAIIIILALILDILIINLNFSFFRFRVEFTPAKWN